MTFVPPDPADVIQRLRILEREMEALKDQQRVLPRVQTVEIRDGAGVVRARIGLLPTGQYGVAVYNAAGTPTFTQSNP
jgi:hypothetical protein